MKNNQIEAEVKNINYINKLCLEFYHMEQDDRRECFTSYPGYAHLHSVEEYKRINDELDRLSFPYSDKLYFSKRDIVKITDKAICVKVGVLKNMSIWCPMSQMKKVNNKIFMLPTWILYKNYWDKRLQQIENEK